MTAPVSQSTAITADAPAISGAPANASEYQSSSTEPAMASVICASAKMLAARGIDGSYVCTCATSKCGLCQGVPVASAGSQPGGFTQTRTLSLQRSQWRDLRARAAYTSRFAHSGSQELSGARVPYTQRSVSSTNVPKRRSHAMSMPP